MTTPFSWNIVTLLPSKTLGTLFKNPKQEDPNIYVLLCGHCFKTDTVNITLLNFENITLDAKVLNTNIWIDVAVAVLTDPSQIKYEVNTEFVVNPFFLENEDVSFFTNYRLNNSLVKVITSNVRDPNYQYPQEINRFFYPESILLREAQGIKGASGSPVVNTKNQIVALGSKIVSEFSMDGTNLVCTKMSMIDSYLFNEKYGLIPAFYEAYQKNPAIINSFKVLNVFRQNFTIVLCHIGYCLVSSREVISSGMYNLTQSTLGSFLTERFTGINKVTYELTPYIIKNDPDIFNFQTLLDFTEITDEYFINKTKVLLTSLTYIDRRNGLESIIFGIDSFAQYYVNGDPSAPVTITYRLYGPAGENGTNMIYGPEKKITIQPILIDDGEKRWSSQLPRVITNTTSRANSMMQSSLFNKMIGGGKYIINYATPWDDFEAAMRILF